MRTKYVVVVKLHEHFPHIVFRPTEITEILTSRIVLPKRIYFVVMSKIFKTVSDLQHTRTTNGRDCLCSRFARRPSNLPQKHQLSLCEPI